MTLLDQTTETVRGLAGRSVLRLPAPVIRRLAGAPVVVEGRTLDPQIQLLLRLMALEGPAAETVAISRGRKIIDSSSRVAGGSQPIGAVTERSIDGPAGPVNLRFYTPRGLTGQSPALVFVHGGGWIYGGLDSHDALCRVLAERARVRVVSVDYRLAPEAPFPAALDDVAAAWTWVNEHAHGIGIDPDRIAIGGDSAGGNIAAVISQRGAAGDLVAPAFQLLIYPATDFAERAPSRSTFADGFFLTRAFMDLAEENYLVGDEDRAGPGLSPLRAPVAGVAPAHVVTAGFDPLRDEGDAYAAALADAGVPVTHVCEDAMIHGFANMVAMGTSAPRAVDRIAQALQRGLS